MYMYTFCKVNMYTYQFNGVRSTQQFQHFLEVSEDSQLFCVQKDWEEEEVEEEKRGVRERMWRERWRGGG